MTHACIKRRVHWQGQQMLALSCAIEVPNIACEAQVCMFHECHTHIPGYLPASNSIFIVMLWVPGAGSPAKQYSMIGL